jgi:hypothetical protein
VSTLSQDATQSWSGAYSLKSLNAGAAPDWTSTQALTVALATQYYFVVRVLGVVGQTYNVVVYSIFPGTIAATTSFVADGTWQETSLAFTSTSTTPTYRVGAAAQAGSPFYTDGIEVRDNTGDTYIDGDQIDCLWDGDAHNSSSRLIADRRGGGEVVDIESAYNFKVGVEGGAGMLGPGYKELDRVDRAGTEATGIKVPRRIWQLGGIFDSGNFQTVRKNRNEFSNALGAYSAPFVNGTPQPVRVRYVGSEKTLQIDARYAGGLDNEVSGNTLHTNRAALRLLANDNPYWYALPQDGAEVDANTTFTHYGIAGRIDGLWGNVNVGSITGVGIIEAVAVARNGTVFVGGNFTQINGIANTVNCAYYSPLSQTWNPLQTGLNATVMDILPLPDGRVVLVGFFTAVTGANDDYTTVYDPTTNTFAALNANELNGFGRAATLDPTTGDVLIVGDFTQDAVPTTLNRIARWDTRGGNFTAVASAPVGVDGTLYGVGVRSDGQIIVAGDQTEQISALDPGGTAFYEVGINGGANGRGLVVFVDLDTDTVYAGGLFTTFDGETVNRIVKFGTISSTYVQFEALGSGLSDNGVYAIIKAQNGDLYVGGDFTFSSDLYTDGSQFIWTGSKWIRTRLQIKADGSDFTNDFAVARNGDIYQVGEKGTSTSQTSPLTAITLPDGAAATFPVFEFVKDGNSSGEHTLVTIENFTTGSRLSFDSLDLLDSEIVRINCQDDILESSFGRNLDGFLLDGSLSDFYLQAGINDIYVFIEDTTADTLLARAFYNTNYETVDAAEDSD